MDEEVLVRAARQGSRDAFNRLVERYSRAVLACHFGRARDLAVAEDLSQETFLRAWQGLHRLQDPCAFGGWLLGIGGFVGLEWLRTKSAEYKFRASLEAVTSQAGVEGPDPGLAQAVSELAPGTQQLLLLRHHCGLSCEEIAQQLGRPLGTVTKTLSRAYERLRSRLARK